MIVTDIKICKKNQILIYADGEYLISMSAEIFSKSKLKKGSYIDQEILNSIMQSVNSYKAKEKALRSSVTLEKNVPKRRPTSLKA